MDRIQYLSLLSIVSFYITNVLSASPLSMTWSDQKFGPDGPWQAVLVKVGIPSTKIALYPGDRWASNILASEICDNTIISSTCYARKAGVLDTNSSATYNGSTGISIFPRSEWQNDTWGSKDAAVSINVLGGYAADTFNVEGIGYGVKRTDLIAWNDGYYTYPSGKSFPLQMGTLSLGAPDTTQVFDNIAVNMVPGYLYELGDSDSHKIPSYSWGIHIGSASLGIPGSGVLGGYDKSRVLGDVSAQPFTNTKFPIKLLDISLGVESGGSPWSTGNVTGLFANGNSSLRSGLTVNAEPIDPYVYLPKSTCKAIAAQLPVTYRSDLSIYTWNTDDSMYRKIVTSPSYLAFTFVKDNTNTMNITIKVPFALLNLTLEEPLVSSPTAYFPCMGADTQFSLGRAFLQSAFIGVNWKSSERSWFLAQAPGPGVGLPDIVTLEDDAGSFPAVSLSSWESSWSNHWTKLTPNGSESVPNSTVSNETTQAGDDGGLSTGAKAGIGIGCAAVGLAAIMVAVWCFIRRRKQPVEKPANGHVVSQAVYNNQLSLVPVGASSDFSGQSYSGTAAESFPQELDAGRKRTGPYELS